MHSDTDLSKQKRIWLERLIVDYGDSLLRLCFLYLGNVATAQDAVQDTFLKAYRSYAEFRGASAEKTWLIRIAINTCKNYMRSPWLRLTNRSVVPESLPEPAAYDADSTDDTVITEIMRLSGKYKEVLLFYYYLDMKTSEVAQTLGIPEATVSIRLKRARERLKPQLEEWYYEEWEPEEKNRRETGGTYAG
jgi:RNA polymerase sigma factor (sigma-70 family)